MNRGLISLAAIAGALAACEATPPPGTGWSRAPDLAVYSAMLLYADVAQQQSILCGGFSTASTESHWRRDFGARTDAVTSALVARHGGAAVSEAEASAVATRRVSCEDVPTTRWRNHYHRLLRLLETRLGLA
jgi:hypothetical protein